MFTVGDVGEVTTDHRLWPNKQYYSNRSGNDNTSQGLKASPCRIMQLFHSQDPWQEDIPYSTKKSIFYIMCLTGFSGINILGRLTSLDKVCDFQLQHAFSSAPTWPNMLDRAQLMVYCTHQHIAFQSFFPLKAKREIVTDKQQWIKLLDYE